MSREQEIEMHVMTVNNTLAGLISSLGNNSIYLDVVISRHMIGTESFYIELIQAI